MNLGASQRRGIRSGIGGQPSPDIPVQDGRGHRRSRRGRPRDQGGRCAHRHPRARCAPSILDVPVGGGRVG